MFTCGRPRKTMLQHISSEQFRDLQEMPLILESGGRQYSVTVTEVRIFTPHSERPEPPFSVVLHAAREVVLPQGIYRLHHPTLNALDLFIVPIGPDARGMRYEIVFN
jgi:hypothetical protein